MKIQVAMTSISTAALLALHGCASISGTNSVAVSPIPESDPSLDHYIAWVPRDKAQTATVAEAMTHISLVNAREQTAKQLCSGDRVINGEAMDNVGPLPISAPESAGGYPAWYYRISHRPGLHGCQNADAREFYHALQKNLPEWMDIRTAGATLSLLD